MAGAPSQARCGAWSARFLTDNFDAVLIPGDQPRARVSVAQVSPGSYDMQGAAATARLFPETLRLRAPRGLPAAVAVAARHRHMTPSEWARQSILRCLEAD